MNRKKDAALPDQPFVSFGFIFRNTQTDESANDAANCAANACTRESSHDRTCGNERTDAWNRKRPDAREPSQRAAHAFAGACPCCCALRSLRVFLRGEVLRANILRK